MGIHLRKEEREVGKGEGMQAGRQALIHNPGGEKLVGEFYLVRGLVLHITVKYHLIQCLYQNNTSGEHGSTHV